MNEGPAWRSGFFMMRHFATIFLFIYARVPSVSSVQMAARTIGKGVFRP